MYSYYKRVSQKFFNIRCVYHVTNKFKPWFVPTMIVSTVLVGAQTRCAWLHCVLFENHISERVNKTNS